VSPRARARGGGGRRALALGLLLAAADAAAGGQTALADYEQARRVFWSRLYADGGETLYCGRSFTGPGTQGVNVEHVLPMSWVTRALDCGSREQCRIESERFRRIEADLHNLWPALTHVNDARGALAFGEVAGEAWRFRGCDFEVDERRRVAEPRPAARGEIARSMFYMSREYGLPIYARQGRELQAWNRADPPSDEERRRNDLIQAIQGTRNRFIDDPGLADQLRF
jgi:deoxyribonuclease-1